MEKLRATIEQYGRWKELGQYIDRMEGHLESDFSISLENAHVPLVAGETLILSTSDTAKTYQRLVDEFADGVVARLK